MYMFNQTKYISTWKVMESAHMNLTEAATLAYLPCR